MTKAPPRPKLLFYIPGLLDGGAERLWACLATAFHARGYPVVFAQDFEASQNRHNLDPAIPVHTLGRSHLGGVRALSALITTERPDAALAAVAGSNLKLMLALARARSHAAPILTYHGFNEWRTGAASFATFAALPLMSRRSARVVAVSNGLRQALVSRWGSHGQNTLTLHNPVYVPPDAPVPAMSDIASRQPLILSAGRLSPDKDLATLIRAMAHVKHCDAKLVILGQGPERERLEAEITRLGLGTRVVLAGYVPEPWEHYRAARLFVCASRSESFGNTLVEAMAHGLSIVSTDCTGPREILDGGSYGRLTPVGDAESLARAIDASLNAPSDPMAQRQRAAEFSFAARMPAYERLIAEVLAERASSVARSSLPRLAAIKARSAP